MGTFSMKKSIRESAEPRMQGRKIKTVVYNTSSQTVKSPAPTEFTILCLFFPLQGIKTHKKFTTCFGRLGARKRKK